MSTVEMTPETLFENGHGLIFWYLRRVFWRNLMDKDDLIQEAEIALWRASCHFKPELGFKFSTFAVKYIKTAIWHAIRREWKQKRNMFQGSSNEPDAVMTVERMAMSRNEPVEEKLMRSEELEKFRKILATIDGLAGETLRRRADGQTLQEIGAARGVSTERARQNLIVFHGVAREHMEGRPVTPLPPLPVVEPEVSLISPEPLWKQVMEMWKKFYTVDEIAKVLKLTPEAVQAAKNEARQIAAAAVSR